jgi:BspA type Leucine rich repeat region (6 copies)
VTEIPYQALYQCSSLLSVIISSSIITIGGYSFASSSSLSTIIIGSNVQYINVHAFQYTAITTIMIPNSVKMIGNAVFQSCQSLSTVAIGKFLVMPHF